MILNTGQRTDIPAYYSDWFYNRIKEGYVLVRNPFYPTQVTKYLINPEVVDIICFCSKNPEPMLERFHELDAFKKIFHITITPYGREIEPNVPEYPKVLETFKRVSEFCGKNAMALRYDPIFISEKYTVDFHKEAFSKMVTTLSGYTDEVIVSFIDMYEKTIKNFPEAMTVPMDIQWELIEYFVNEAKKVGMRVKTCLENPEFERAGAVVTGCMAKEDVERVLQEEIVLRGNKYNVREGCNCLLGGDIGAYNSCGHGCKYCYANYDTEVVKANMKLHDKNSPMLIGNLTPQDIVHESLQQKFATGQRFFSL
ncbi:MAG: DUF1848 domain-containing protein [Lachnospiraceae bacterium]|nr:DUF1848 domain-containing protein [Lachnospiraceae bacterium]